MWDMLESQKFDGISQEVGTILWMGGGTPYGKGYFAVACFQLAGTLPRAWELGICRDIWNKSQGLDHHHPQSAHTLIRQDRAR